MAKIVAKYASRISRRFSSLLMFALVLLIWVLSPRQFKPDDASSTSPVQKPHELYKIASAPIANPIKLKPLYWTLGSAVSVYFVSRSTLPTIHIQLAFRFEAKQNRSSSNSHHKIDQLAYRDIVEGIDFNLLMNNLTGFLQSARVAGYGTQAVTGLTIAMVGDLDTDQARHMSEHIAKHFNARTLNPGEVNNQHSINPGTQDFTALLLYLYMSGSRENPFVELNYEELKAFGSLDVQTIDRNALQIAKTQLRTEILLNVASNYALSKTLALIGIYHLGPDYIRDFQQSIEVISLKEFIHKIQPYL